MSRKPLMKVLIPFVVFSLCCGPLSVEVAPKEKDVRTAMNNVVLTPHLGWYTEEAGWDIRHMILNDLKAYLKGKPPRFVINSEVFDSPKLRMNSVLKNKELTVS